MFGSVFRSRRDRLRKLLPGMTAVFHNGKRVYRSIPASSYPFRGNSHFLYFCGIQPPGALLVVGADRDILFLEPQSEEDPIWEGKKSDWAEAAEDCAVDEVRSKSEAGSFLERFPAASLAALPSLNRAVTVELEGLLGRSLSLEQEDRCLGEAVATLRLIHDDFALSELRKAAEITAEAMLCAFHRSKSATHESQVLAEVEAAFIRQGARSSFSSVVTTAGNILHNESSNRPLTPGELLLVDIGGETEQGYTADLTRTWPVGGKFSALQADLYQAVLDAQEAALITIEPGRRFLEVHLSAARVLTERLIDIGALKGRADDLVENGVHALFFPHGVGHLLGLDPHDLEDLGDIAGYEQGRKRQTQFGLHNLRLDRDLRANMLVTVEPGLYWIPALLDDSLRIEKFKQHLNLDRIRELRGVKGIRIEDDVLVTESGREVLTAAVPKKISEVEAVLS